MNEAFNTAFGYMFGSALGIGLGIILVLWIAALAGFSAGGDLSSDSDRYNEDLSSELFHTQEQVFELEERNSKLQEALNIARPVMEAHASPTRLADFETLIKEDT